MCWKHDRQVRAWNEVGEENWELDSRDKVRHIPKGAISYTM